MTTTKTARRLRAFATAYARDTWGIDLRPITADEVLMMELRSDGWANAHVEGEHEALGTCPYRGKIGPRTCGERMAASEFVETTDGLTTPAPRTGSHAGHDHPATKSARAACRRSAKAVLSDIIDTLAKEN